MRSAISQSPRFTSYSLISLLPEGFRLVVDERTGVLILLEDGEVREVQRFTLVEFRILLSLLGQFPHYCPHPVLVQAYYGGSLEECERKVQEAEEDGDFDALIRPARNLISRIRIKIREFGVDVRSLLETGYVLMPVSRKEVSITLSNSQI
jgi:hypothetical protein